MLSDFFSDTMNFKNGGKVGRINRINGVLSSPGQNRGDLTFEYEIVLYFSRINGIT